MQIEFQGWPKTSRLSRETMTITEKIDGTNAAVGVVHIEDRSNIPDGMAAVANFYYDGHGNAYAVYAQSRKRIITPTADNFGFARWVWDNTEALADVLGTGLHFGEWWGEGIQRTYGVKGKRFSLFNTHRWGWMGHAGAPRTLGIPDALGAVPVFGTFPFRPSFAEVYLNALRGSGSLAAPGYDNPEGICIYLVDAGKTYKMTFDGDQPKYLVGELHGTGYIGEQGELAA